MKGKANEFLKDISLENIKNILLEKKKNNGFILQFFIFIKKVVSKLF